MQATPPAHQLLVHHGRHAVLDLLGHRGLVLAPQTCLAPLFRCDLRQSRLLLRLLHA
jgi:hypothetical protein